MNYLKFLFRSSAIFMISLLPSNLFCELDKNMDKIKQFFFWERMNMISLGILLNQFVTLLVITYYCHRQAPWSLS